VKLVTPTELTDLTSRAFRTVSRCLKAAGLEPRERSKTSELYASDQALEAIYGRSKVSPLEDARTRLALEQTARLARERAVAENDLAPRAAIAVEVGRLIAATMTRMRSVPDAIAHHFDGDIAQRLRAAVGAEIDRALEDLKTNSERIARGDRREAGQGADESESAARWNTET